ncbi:MAG: phosphatase PAP2 family protein [Halapricum sp.]
MKVSLGPRDVWYLVPPLLASGIASMASKVTPFSPRTPAVHGLEGDVVSLFQTVTHPGLTAFFVLVYVGFYPLLLGLTYLGLKREPGNRHVDYAATYTAVVLISTPLFYFAPVGVTGYFLEGVEPLLYEGSSVVGSIVTSVDTLQKAMPSLHLGLAAVASLHAPRGYRFLSWAATGLIALSTLYLGIHWVTDLIVGGTIAYGCYISGPLVRAHVHDRREPAPADAVRGD